MTEYIIENQYRKGEIFSQRLSLLKNINVQLPSNSFYCFKQSYHMQKSSNQYLNNFAIINCSAWMARLD